MSRRREVDWVSRSSSLMLQPTPSARWNKDGGMIGFEDGAEHLQMKHLHPSEHLQKPGSAWIRILLRGRGALFFLHLLCLILSCLLSTHSLLSPTFFFQGTLISRQLISFPPLFHQFVLALSSPSSTPRFWRRKQWPTEPSCFCSGVKPRERMLTWLCQNPPTPVSPGIWLWGPVQVKERRQNRRGGQH